MNLRVEMLANADRLLRGRASSGVGKRVVVLIVAGSMYGAVMGTFGGVGVSHWLQIFYSAVKVPLLLGVTFSLSLPFFFVINTLFGLRSDFQEALSAVAGTQAILTLVLASLAPVTAFWYFCDRDYQRAVLFNGVMFAVASVGSQMGARGAYRPLIARRPTHRWMLRLWLMIYAFVGIQMAWVLRPFVGDPGMTTSFIRPDSISNAYVTVGKMLWSER